MALPTPPEAGVSGSNLLPGLMQACPELQTAARIVVGFSGGVDSTVLLHLLQEARETGLLGAQLHALHVNHMLQEPAVRWEQHCKELCAKLAIALDCVREPVVQVSGKSLEETARNARHAVFKATLQAGDVLVLAHHQDDQVETVFFRLLRGSGAAGLAGMPRTRPCGNGLLLRPLLNATRAELLSFAHARNLAWVEDGSNANQRFDRNFLRASVLPLLRERWPGLGGAVQRSARLAGDAAALLDELAMIDTAAAAGRKPEQLRVDALLALSEARQRNVLRYWLLDLCSQRAWAAPTHNVLARIVSEVVMAEQDAEPLLTWGEGNSVVELRRHGGLLHVLAPLPDVPETIGWDAGVVCALPAPLGSLELVGSSAQGLPRDRLRELNVRFRGGGEHVKPAGRPTRALKKILQDAGIPPWLRQRIPLLYAGDELIAVADLFVCDGWLSESAENACRVVWKHPDLDCGAPPHLLI